jgi:hypothetical protein
MNQQNQNNPTQDSLPNWVSVKERYPMPNDGDRKGNVLGWDKFQKEVHKCYMEDIHRMTMRFTHWMPLPKEPGSNVIISGETIEGQTVLIAEEIKSL